MANPIKTLVQDYGWIHLSLGLAGNPLFFVGSLMFMPAFKGVPQPSWLVATWQTAGVWLFVVGSFLMLIGALGTLLVRLFHP